MISMNPSISIRHSLSQKSPRNSKTDKPENGSIAEEIDDEEIDEISIEADDLLRSEKSGVSLLFFSLNFRLISMQQRL